MIEFIKLNLKENVRILIALLLFMSISFYFIQKSNRQLEQNTKYTIAIAIENTYGKSYNGIKYKYSIDGKLYSQWCARPANKIAKEGAKYFIAYNRNNPEQSELFVDCPVPDSIIITPYRGMDNVPIPKYQEIINKYYKSLNKFSFDSY